MYPSIDSYLVTSAATWGAGPTYVSHTIPVLTDGMLIVLGATRGDGGGPYSSINNTFGDAFSWNGTLFPAFKESFSVNGSWQSWGGYLLNPQPGTFNVGINNNGMERHVDCIFINVKNAGTPTLASGTTSADATFTYTADGNSLSILFDDSAFVTTPGAGQSVLVQGAYQDQLCVSYKQAPDGTSASIGDTGGSISCYCAMGIPVPGGGFVPHVIIM